MLHADAAMMIPHAHQLHNQPSPFIDSGVHLDLLARSSSNVLVQSSQQLPTAETDDDVFTQENLRDDVQLTSSSSVDSSSSSNTTVVTEMPSNGLSRSRRSHFSRKDSTPEMASKAKPESE